MIAAQILLQTHLDAGCPDAEAPASPLDDPSSTPEEDDVP